jgi:antitoxin YefM
VGEFSTTRVDNAERTHERFDITRYGRRAAVPLAAEDYDSMRETIEILSDSQAMVELRESEADIAAGRASSLETVIVGLRESGRGPHPSERRRRCA